MRKLIARPELYVPLSLFCSALFYAATLTLGIKVVESIATVLFVLITTFCYWKIGLRIAKEVTPSTPLIVSIVLAIPLGLVIAAEVFGNSADFFWAADAIGTHVPRSDEVAQWLWGVNQNPLYLPQVLLTHAWIGVWFAIFGTKPWVSVLGLALIKAGTCLTLVRLSKLLFKSDSYQASFLVYLAIPNVLFHTTVFYKEAMVHLLVSLGAWAIVASIHRLSLKSSILFVLFFLGLFVERYYLVIVFAPIAVFMLFKALKSKRLITSGILVAGTLAVAIFHPYADYGITAIIEQARHLRKLHSLYSDVSYQYNYEIPFFVAVLKTLATPIWSPGKLDIFHGFAALITWGSFLNQLVICAYLLGAIRAVRRLGYTHFIIQVPFILLVLFIAYISPWAGRLRDSFAPLIALYSCFYVIEYLRHDFIWIMQRFNQGLRILRRP